MVSYPAASAVLGAAADALLVGASLAALPLLLFRIRRIALISVLVASLVAIYTLGTLGGAFREQGGIHTIAVGTAGATLLFFSAYGDSLMAAKWFRRMAGLILVLSVVCLAAASMPKNITAGAIVYAVALLSALFLEDLRRRRAANILVMYIVGASVIAFTFDFRALFALIAVFLLATAGATRLSRNSYRVAGLAGAFSTCYLILWYFTNSYGSGLAASISAAVQEYSGRPATSGRESLWPAILDSVSEHAVYGLGSGALPRDIFATTLSAHNYYVQAYMQVGLVGLFTITAILCAVWIRLTAASSELNTFTAALFVVFVIHNSTEVLMFQNALVVSIPAWAAIGLGIARTHSIASAQSGDSFQNGQAHAGTELPSPPQS